MTFSLRGITLLKIPKLFVQNTEIYRLHSFKCLTFILNEKLNWTKHVNYVFNKLTSSS